MGKASCQRNFGLSENQCSPVIQGERLKTRPVISHMREYIHSLRTKVAEMFSLFPDVQNS